MASAAGTATDELKAFNDQLKKLAQDAREHAEAIQRMANSFANAVRNMVSAGFAGTQEAARLGLAWTLLSRQIASLFIPVVNALTLGMTQLTSLFAGLSGHGQMMALSFGAVALAIATKLPLLMMLQGAFGLLSSILSPITLMLGALVQGIMDFLTGTMEGQMIMAAMSEAMSILGTVFKYLGAAFAVVADAVTVALQYLIRGFTWVVVKIAGFVETILDWIPGMGDATESVRKFRENAEANLEKMSAGGDGASKKVTEKKRNDVTPGALKFEELNAAFERVSQAGAKVGGGPEESRHNAAMTKQEMLIAAVNGVKESVDKKPGAIGR